LRRADANACSVFDIDTQALSARAFMNLAASLDSWQLPRVLPSRTAH
jgi:hypothetical protein